MQNIDLIDALWGAFDKKDPIDYPKSSDNDNLYGMALEDYSFRELL